MASREGGLLAWQWRGYARNHRDRLNLLLHFVAVPMFIAGALATVVQLAHGLWISAAIAFATMAVAFALQGIGHKREAEAPVPFDGPLDFVSRVFVEQFVTFPRFLLSGDWMRQMARAEDSNRGPHG
ncbi:MAG: DUF962 domain-containing protein [Paludibaculum sp.]